MCLYSSNYPGRYHGLGAESGWQFCRRHGVLKTLVTVRDNYVEPVDDEKLFDGATSGMVKALGDPYSAYLDKKSFSEITDLTDGVFGGIGVVLGKKDDDFVVVAPMKGTPGDEAGIKAGDKILAVDGTNVDGMQLEDVVAKIRGKQGTEVELLLESADGAERTVRVIRGDIKVESVGGQMLPGTKIGYIRISVFNEQTGADFAKKYIELEKEGMQALLLDLRHNPGGILGECVKVAQYIVPKGTVVSIKDRSGNTFVEESNLEKLSIRWLCLLTTAVPVRPKLLPVRCRIPARANFSACRLLARVLFNPFIN